MIVAVTGGSDVRNSAMAVVLVVTSEIVPRR